MNRPLEAPTRDAYRAWFKASNDFAEACETFLELKGTEDLGDWVDSIRTLLSFSPHPKTMWPNDHQEV
jgi:hypothetical protein